MDPRLSVIIVTYNSENDIFYCLDSLFHYNDLPPGALQVIIVDNNSTHQAELFNRIAQRYAGSVECVANPTNAGYGQGNNVGLRRARADVVLIVNPDVRFIMPMFKEVTAEFARRPQLSEYGMKQMLSPTKASSNSFACTNMMNGYVATVLSALGTRLDWYWPRYMYFSGSCFFIRRQMFVDTGLFNEHVFMYGEEDYVHCRLGRRFGYHMHYNPHLRYIHLVGERKPDFAYERRVIDAVVTQGEYNNYPARLTVLNRLRSTRLQLWRASLKALFRHVDPALVAMLGEKRDYLKHRLNLSK